MVRATGCGMLRLVLGAAAGLARWLLKVLQISWVM
jgi:hypothetical protein